MKLKTFCAAKGNHQQNERQSPEQEIVFASDMTHKGLIYKKYVNNSYNLMPKKETTD